MKKILITTILAIISMILFSACEDNRLNNTPDDQIYLVKHGETVYKISSKESKLSTEVAIYKSGLNRGATNVQLTIDPSLVEKYNAKNGTSYKILPTEYYTIGQTEFHFGQEKDKEFTKVEIDIPSLERLQGIRNKEYVLPIKLSTTGEVAVIEDKSELILVPELTGGIRANSATVIWSKGLADMGINGTDHNTASMAVTDKYLYVNTRNQDLKYYDRFTGEYAGSIELPFKGNLTNFTVTNDDANSLLITNLRNQAAGTIATQTIYKIKDNGTPEKFIEVDHSYPNGRKLRVTGNLDTNALITSTIENTSQVLYWQVEGGKLLLQEPKIYSANSSQVGWYAFGTAVAVSTNLDDGMLLVGYGPVAALGYCNKEGNLDFSYNLVGAGFDPTAGFVTQTISKTTFNGAVYMAVGAPEWGYHMHSRLLDITEYSNLSLDPNSPDLLVYKPEAPIWCTENANMTGDVQLKASEEKETMVMYVLGTNGGIVATQFDSKVE